MLDRKTAELMLKNFTLKLGALALAQESKKGFPQGIPAVAKPYMQAMGIKEEDVLPDKQVSGVVDQLNQKQQQQQSNSDATMASPTEEQDEQYGPEAEEAQQINSDRPVATPEPEVDEEAGMMPEEPQMQYGGMYADRNFAFQNGGWLPEEVAVFTGTVPYAEYGRALGANPQNYEGRKRHIHGATRFFQEGGYLAKAQDGIEVDASNMTEDQMRRAIWDEQQKALAEWKKKNPGKDPKTSGYTEPQISVKRKDASGNVKTSKLKSSGFIIPPGKDIAAKDLQGFPDTDDGRTALAQYMLIKENLDNPAVKAEIIKNTREIIEDPKAWKGKTGALDPNRTFSKKFPGQPATDDEIIQQALNLNKRNLTFTANGIDPQLYSDVGHRLDTVDEVLAAKYVNPKTGKEYTRDEATAAIENLDDKGYTTVAKLSESLNVPLDAKGRDRILQQAGMHSYAKAYQNFKSGAYESNPDLQYSMDNFLGNVSLVHAGAKDETSMGALYGPIGNKISPLDDQYTYSGSWYGTSGLKKSGSNDPLYTTYGDTTAGEKYMVGKRDYQFEDEPEDEGKSNDIPKEKPKDCPCDLPDGTRIYVGRDPNTGECNPCEKEVPVDIEQPAEWWLQDTIKTTGAFGDLMSIKKHMPWAPRVDLETPRPTFLDPTRELAANAEQANIQTQGMAQFAGPQALSARSSGIQGQAAKNAADVLSRYNNANVNIANQFETQATNIRNQEQGMNQAASQRLYDQNTIANQQFDNSKMAMRNQLRNYYTNAITNRAKTDALNQLYPQYAVSPATGGFLRYKQGRDFTGKSTGTEKTYDEWFQYYKDKNQSDADAATNARNALNAQKNSGGGSSNAATAVNNMGYKKKGGYVYADVTYPFIL
jgi:hypothetical protein